MDIASLLNEVDSDGSSSDTSDQAYVQPGPKYQLRVTPPPRDISPRRLSNALSRLSKSYVSFGVEVDEADGFALPGWVNEEWVCEEPKAKSKSSKSKAKFKAKAKTPKASNKTVKAACVTKPKTKGKKRIRRTSHDLLLAAAGPNAEQEVRSRPTRRVYEGKYKGDKLSIAPKEKNIGKTE